VIPPLPSVGVVADDLAGAAIAASRLRTAGLRTLIVRGREVPRMSVDALVVDADLRAAAAAGRTGVSSPQEVVRSTVRRLQGSFRCRWIDLRIDAALRRDYVAEVDGALDAADTGFRRPLAIAILALPEAGRRTVRGHQLIRVGAEPERSKPVHPSLFGSNPARIIPLEIVRLGAEAIADAIDSQVTVVSRFIVDAKADCDLAAIAAGLGMLESRHAFITVSSGGWLRFHPAADHAPPFVLVAMGLTTSPNEAQLDALQAAEPTRVILPSEAHHIVTDPDALLVAVRNAVLVVKAEGEPVADIDRITSAQMVARACLSLLVATRLAGVRCAGAVGTGAYTASELANALEATSLLPVGGYSDVRPLSLIGDGPWKGLPIVVKGGLVGHPGALVESVGLIRDVARWL
jgi:D-threonate/D-erythronate kinase